uniref:Mcf.2 cell line derived transforming sequence-like a n=1 Tax=Cyprinus carpio TaxID=7962 RepID=A0A8C1V0D9_CYPCA
MILMEETGMHLRPPEENCRSLVKITVEEMESFYRFIVCCDLLIYEIMQQESSPLCAADISLDLRKQFAFLSGGRGQNGSPIIIFPEYPTFGELEEQEFHNVLTYLTSVPSLSSTGVGFILVIDRRQDRWASVKGTLLRIAGSFPGNLQLVLVLRPTALFQRTISDIFFKLNKDEFKMKVPVIMLSSVTELHSYIDRTQLTQELGGTQEYCHEKWISHRTAIEGFALMVKKTAQILQSFGTELAETELPNDVEATSNLLIVHTEKKDKMKEDLRIALCQGSRLLESINEPLVKDPDYTMNQDELENLATVQRLLGQLDETETAFDDFWDKHQTKLEQCLQLRHFEQNFREVRAHLDMVYDRVSGFSEVGISPAHIEHILKELTNYEDRAYEVLDQALALACDADQLIEASHYAVDSILPKCSELRAVCEEISGVLEAKKTHLLKAMDLHQCLEKATKWCEDGIYLLASQPVDKCQSQDGAESALQEIERYLETANQHKLTDLSGIWRDYESVLTQDFRDQVDKVFQKQLSMQEMFEKRRFSLKKLAAKQTRPVQPVAPRPEAIKPPTSSPADREKTIEGDIINGNCRKEEMHLQNDSSRHTSVSDEEENFAVLRRHVMNELLETERAYVEELLCVLEGYGAEMDNPAMAHLIPNTLLHKKDILFGNMPEIYQFHKKTFLRELETYTDYPELVGRCFLERMTDLQIYEKYCQNKPRSESLWRQCSDCAFFQECQKKLEHKLGLDSYLLKPVQRITKYQLLLKELLKYSKGCEGADYLQEALSSILGILKAVNDSMHLIAITGYEVKMMFTHATWCNSREEVYIVQASTPEIKTAWVNEIRKVLTGQLKAYREASQQKSSDQISQLTPTSTSLTQSPFKTNPKTLKKGEEKKTEPTAADSSTAVLLKNDKVKGFSKASLSVDASEENDGYSSAEDPMNSDPEDEGGRKLSPGRYVVVADHDKSGPQELTVKSGDTVQLTREGDDGRWFVRNLRTNKEGWVPAANLLTLIGESKSSQSLSSLEGSGSGNLSTSSSCSETYTSFSDIKA